MAHVLRCDAINTRYFDSDVYRRTFKIMAPQCSRSDIFKALVSLLKQEDIISIEKSDVSAFNIVVATDRATDILMATDNILIKETHRQVFYVARQHLSLLVHWLPSYIKDIFLEEFFSQYGEVECQV